MIPLQDVAVLYADAAGPYTALDWYGEERDARTFPGGKPVVAHPPCGPWSRLRNWCRHQDAGAGLHAVDVLRACGGVLEHPAESTLFAATAMPRPFEPPDRWGGYTVPIEQWRYGHRSVKPTWLYIVGVPQDVVASILDVDDAGLARPASGAFWKLGDVERRLTPPDLARRLVEIAGSSRGPSDSTSSAAELRAADWARVVRSLRGAGGQRWLAGALGVSQSRVTRLERGAGGALTADELVRLARITGASVQAIVSAATA